MSKTMTGARVRYCGHDASFIADVRESHGVAVVVAGADAGFEEKLTRPAGDECQFHLNDFPDVIYWGRRRGVFVVPTEQLKDLRKDEGVCQCDACASERPLAGPIKSMSHPPSSVRRDGFWIESEGRLPDA